jgi:ubiquinol-cytochrome c reductase cytochrome c subunit
MTMPRSIAPLAALAAALGAASLAGGAVSAQPNAPTGDATRGYATYVRQGCYECHGYQGQGSGHRGNGGEIVGPMLAPGPIPYGAYLHQLRAPRESMPPYSANILSDRDAADIYAYLASIPPSKSPSSIPLLASVGTGSAGSAPADSVARGHEIFAANCAACHGATGREGGAGPSLAGERTRKDLAATIAFIENPTPPMPKLYPSPLSAADVRAVATYVQSLQP